MIVDMEAATLGTGVSRATLYRWMSKGLLEPVRRYPVAVRLDDVERVRDEQHAAQIAPLARGPVRVRR